eukprot:scaffold52748_cov60-Phaeocystis_antarctica.AAC.2
MSALVTVIKKQHKSIQRQSVCAHTSPLGTVSIRLDRQRAEQNAASYARYTSCPCCMIRLAHAAFAHTACFSCRRSEAKPTPRCHLDH